MSHTADNSIQYNSVIKCRLLLCAWKYTAFSSKLFIACIFLKIEYMVKYIGEFN